MSPLPSTLLRGHLRTSTAALTVAFFALLTVWILIRPAPPQYTEEVVTVRTTKQNAPASEQTQAPASTPTPTPAPRTPSPTPRPRETATPTPAAPIVTPTLVPPAGGGLFPGPTPTPLPPAVP